MFPSDLDLHNRVSYAWSINITKGNLPTFMHNVNTNRFEKTILALILALILLFIAWPVGYFGLGTILENIMLTIFVSFFVYIFSFTLYHIIRRS